MLSQKQIIKDSVDASSTYYPLLLQKKPCCLSGRKPHLQLQVDTNLSKPIIVILSPLKQTLAQSRRPKSFSSFYATSRCDWFKDGTIRANLTTFVQWLKKKQLSFFGYEQGITQARCGSQTPRWPPMIPASGYSHLSTIPLSQCTRVCLYDQQGRSDGMSLLRLYNNRLGSLLSLSSLSLSLSLSLITCSGGSQLPCHEKPKQTPI